MADYFFEESKVSDSMWKSSDRAFKRVIWAPHHSILDDDPLDYSNFLEIADDMLALANAYKDKLQFVFKPHPRLKAKLYQHPKWGEARTDAYYDSWAKNPNCSMIEGNYVDLFKSSDCMIHDCSSFTGEYLYVNKPVMFVTKKETIEQFNVFAQECLKMHYRGGCIDDIKRFLDDVIQGIDPMLKQRTAFLNSVLRTNSSNSVAMTIYKDICETFVS
jgi:CDP-glycerol glycerophosphotransferase (TagB/SpsB family)